MADTSYMDKPAILIVDDAPDNLSLMSGLLKDIYKVKIANNGERALKVVLTGTPPDIILLDIMMPVMDGYTVLNTIKSDPAFVGIPFIFVSARDELPDVRKGMLEGADDYLPKPFSPSELLATITNRLQRIEMHRVQKSKDIIPIENQKLLHQLTPREREVLTMVGKGLTTKAIATQLGIRVNTVDVYRSSLLKKLNAENAAALARWAITAELISSPP